MPLEGAPAGWRLLLLAAVRCIVFRRAPCLTPQPDHCWVVRNRADAFDARKYPPKSQMKTRMKKSSLHLLFFVFSFLLLAGGCGKQVIDSGAPPSRGAPKGTYKPYTIRGKTYTPLHSAESFREEGLASWYGPDFHGKKTASGEIYNMYAGTGAHKILPMGTKVRVTNLENGKRTVVRINDRGPFVRGRVVDVSRAAAEELDMVAKGTVRVRVESIDVVPGYTAPTVAGGAGDMPGSFYVQIGAFTVRENAQALLRTIRGQYTGSRITEAVIGGQRFWRVQCGTFSSLGKAEQARNSLESTYPACFVIAD
jgi:rare lipoprotein A